MPTPSVADLLAPYDQEVRDLVLATRNLVRRIAPDAIEEIDTSARLIGFTFIPGTYKGLIVAVAPQKSYVNINFSRGVELAAGHDPAGLLEGTGKRARHVKIRDAQRLALPELRALIEEAAARTPRPEGQVPDHP
ncbi:DUF1801 domain-containing protein [Rhodococcus sp. NPDC058514]|uniref:DUF1801 domain-containing protein n=1 Tax=unclassified Rhodococcus (in: high G+C Gram-positive bacteria) TaxID=192944 RepID=UPI00364BBE95